MFNRAGFTTAAKAMGYSDDEINQIATMKEAQQSSTPVFNPTGNYKNDYLGAINSGGKINPSDVTGYYNTPKTTGVVKIYDAPDLTGQSTTTTQSAGTQTGQNIKQNKLPTREEAMRVFIKAGYTPDQATAEVNKKYGASTQNTTKSSPTVNKPTTQVKSKGFLEKVGDFLIPQTMDRYRKAFQNFDPNVSKDQKIKNYKDITSGKSTAKSALELGSFVVPAGKGIGSIMKSGALMGGMRGASEGQDFSPSAIVGGAAGGAVMGGIIGGASTLIGGAKNKITQSAVQNLGKGTPTMWQKALEQHGIDLNELIRKYYPEGANYDTVLGGIKERGDGGILGKTIKDAEAQIQATAKAAGTNVRIMPDQLIKALKFEARNIRTELGGENRKAAIEAIIKEAEKKYAKGMTVNQAVTTLRYANKKFAKNIVEVNPGDAVATAAQKLEGNTLRTALKSMFPYLAQSLDTQSEIYTIQPVLNRARAILNTEGSTIRAGQLANVQLLNPLSWGNAVNVAMQNPQIASKVMNMKTGIGPVASAITKGSQVAGGLVGSKLGEIFGPQTPQEGQNIDSTVNSSTYPQGSEQVQNDTYHTTSIAQSPQDVKLGENQTPEYWNTQYLRALAQDPPDEASAKRALDQRDYWTKYKKENTPSSGKPLTTTQMQQQNNAITGLNSIYDILKFQKGDSQSLIKAKLPFALGARKTKFAADNISDVIARLRTGAAINNEEYKLYSNMVYTLFDKPEDTAYKLQQLKVLFERFANPKAAAQDIPAYQDQGLGANPPQL